MSTADDLLAAVRAAPDDDGPRLQYADWAEENGDPERAEFIRLQCALAAMPADDGRRAAMERRTRALVSRNVGRWAATDRLSAGVGWRYVRGFPWSEPIPSGRFHCTIRFRISPAEAAVGRRLQFWTGHCEVTCERCRGSGGEPGAIEVVCPGCRGSGMEGFTDWPWNLLKDRMLCTACSRQRGRSLEPACSRCRGRGRSRVARAENISLEIPAGVLNGAMLEFPGVIPFGEGREPGDLRVLIGVRGAALGT